ncbi:MAG: type I-U CRISPR-associated protein Csx17 [Deltaproteobacteria bacterium]|nr:type I-U CRISPR-associated protein Csx17 [Deltaproteobacteria bacterium]
MAADPRTLTAVAVPGLRPESFGNYLASLGLLRLLARPWPEVRAAWHEGTFHLVGGPATIDDLLDELSDIAARRAWTPYERGWADAQKKSTEARSGAMLALWQASAEERDLEMLSAHAVPAGRVSFNPALGSGGNAGKRDFSDGWKRAMGALGPPAPPKPKKTAPPKRRPARTPVGDATAKGEEERRQKRAELRALLLGEPVSWMLKKLNAACWFSDANKLYNSGQRPFREGAISPWAMALACEGLPFLAGGASRRLGARARAVGAFPFVTEAAAPSTSGEAGRDRAEVWAPLWNRPMTVREAAALFARGRAEVRGRGALTPSAFATAIVRRGVDAGIAEFRRFVLARTTSTNTFEPRFEGAFTLRVPEHGSIHAAIGSTTAASTAIERMLGLIDRLPADRKVGMRWRFVGLRGPIETAMLRLAATPDDPETARAVLDAAVRALDLVDRNRAFRKRRVSWEPLPVEWLPSLFVDEVPGVEARLAMAMVSGSPPARPFALYRFGVDLEYRARFVHAERPPARWVWSPGALPGVLSAVLRRRILDWEQSRDDEDPARLVLPAASTHVARWLGGVCDDGLLARWISRLALFDWRIVPSGVRSLARRATDRLEADGPLCLFGLLQPLFDLRLLRQRGALPAADMLPRASGARTPAAARTLASHLQAGQLDAAMRLATSRYAMAGTALAQMHIAWSVGDPERLLASILFPVFDHERTALAERWLRPRRQPGDAAHG